MAEATLMDMLDQLEALLVGASNHLPHEGEVAKEHVWDARAVAAQMRVLIGPRRPTGEFLRIEREGGG